MGVALPPMSVPKAKVQLNVGKAKPCVCDRLAITGTMVAAKGILSTMAEAKADSHNIRGIPNAYEQANKEEQGPPVHSLNNM